MNTKREVLQAFEDFQKGLLGSIPAIYKEEAKKPQDSSALKRTDKLSGDIKPTSAQNVLDVHNAPTDLQEG
jgi:quercetin 2,3-dioxygenase